MAIGEVTEPLVTFAIHRFLPRMNYFDKVMFGLKPKEKVVVHTSGAHPVFPAFGLPGHPHAT